MQTSAQPYSKLKKYDEALANLNRSYEEAQAISPEPVKNLILTYVSLHKAAYYKNKSEYGNAIVSYTDALNSSQLVDFTAYAYQARKGRLAAYIALAKDEMAENEITEMLKLLENSRSEILSRRIETAFLMQSDVYDLAIDYECSRRKDFRKALDYSEESRSRSLLDLLMTQASIVSGTASLDIKFKEAYSPLTLQAIQERLPENLQVIHYCVLDNKIIVWVVRKGSLSHVIVEISREDLNNKVKAYVEAISHYSEKDPTGISTQSKELFDILVRPVSRLLNRDENICIVPDKILNILPFETLRSTETQKYLIEDFAVIYAQSLSVLTTCIEIAKSKGTPDAERFLGVGDPSFDPLVFKGLSSLSAAKREVEKLRDFYRNLLF